MGDFSNETHFDSVGVQRAARLLARLPPSSANAILERLSPHQACVVRQVIQQDSQFSVTEPESPVNFDFLDHVCQATLFAALLPERPQAIAALLGMTAGRFAPKIIRALSDQRRVEVIVRLTGMSDVDQRTAGELAAGLKQRIGEIEERNQSRDSGIHRVAEILEACDRPTEWSVIRNLGRDHPELTEEIQQVLFDFEDIANLSDDEVQSLARNVLSETWAAALKRCSDFVRRKVFFNLTPRSAQEVRAEMNYIGEPLPSEIDRCQQSIIDVARKLGVPQKRVA